MPSALATLRTNLETALEAQGIISSSAIPVFKYEPAAQDKPGDELIWFGNASQTSDNVAMGPSYVENGELDVVVQVRKPGGGETQHDSAEDRALAIWDEVIAALLADGTVSGAVKQAVPSGYDIEIHFEPNETVCQLTGTVAWFQHVTS